MGVKAWGKPFRNLSVRHGTTDEGELFALFTDYNISRAPEAIITSAPRCSRLSMWNINLVDFDFS